MNGALEISTCDRCHRMLAGRISFDLRTSTGETLKCFGCALLHIPLIKRSLIASLVVGSVLVVLNQGDVMLSAQWSQALLWKIPLTYAVPYLVSTWGALSNARR